MAVNGSTVPHCSPTTDTTQTTSYEESKTYGEVQNPNTVRLSAATCTNSEPRREFIRTCGATWHQTSFTYQVGHKRNFKYFYAASVIRMSRGSPVSEFSVHGQCERIYGTEERQQPERGSRRKAKPDATNKPTKLTPSDTPRTLTTTTNSPSRRN